MKVFVVQRKKDAKIWGASSSYTEFCKPQRNRMPRVFCSPERALASFRLSLKKNWPRNNRAVSNIMRTVGVVSIDEI